ncbi:MAG: TIGR00269 family protein [Candidatus Aenigmarchaeota archaeon]|nr:TIGR00269 family protein [Candidatus Aenigmarchaeota archaeon]
MKKCSRCKKTAFYYRINEGRYYCGPCFSRNIEDRVKKTIRKHNLINDGDRIAVALSGGKDSSNTLYLLKKIFKKNPKIEIFAITIDEGIKNHRAKAIKNSIKFCKELQVKHYVFSFKKEFGFTIDEIAKKSKDKGMCRYCGVLRRYLLNKKARELNANKIALGHNLDDEAQTIVMNVLKGDLLRLARTGPMPLIKESKKFIPRIKPLIMIPEKESALFAIINNIPVSFDKCPYAKFNPLRGEIRDFLNRLENEAHGIKYSVLKSGERLASILKENLKIDEIKLCEKCGEPSSENICKVCKIIPL